MADGAETAVLGYLLPSLRNEWGLTEHDLGPRWMLPRPRSS